MMYRKAMLFRQDAGEGRHVKAILSERNPRKLRALGRSVPGFIQTVWDSEKYAIVLQGNLLRFHSNPEFRQRLLATGTKELVEASPYDRIWGIGYSEKQAQQVHRSQWGDNLLGKVLMEVREVLRRESSVGLPEQITVVDGVAAGEAADTGS